MTTAIRLDQSQLARADVIAARHHAEMARMALGRAFVRLNESGDPDRKPVASALLKATEALELLGDLR
jgi:hypothetical protein